MFIALAMAGWRIGYALGYAKLFQPWFNSKARFPSFNAKANIGFALIAVLVTRMGTDVAILGIITARVYIGAALFAFGAFGQS